MLERIKSRSLTCCFVCARYRCDYSCLVGDIASSPGVDFTLAKTHAIELISITEGYYDRLTKMYKYLIIPIKRAELYIWYPIHSPYVV